MGEESLGEEQVAEADPVDVEPSLEEPAPAVTEDIASVEPEAPMENSEPSFQEPSEADSFASSEAPVVEEEIVAKPSWVPVKKIKSMPFSMAGKNLNTVYIVRPGDSPESVAQKIFGVADTASIYASNPHLRSSFKTGDKLYYQSPNRPTDTNRMLTFYEDNNIPSQSRVLRSGENVRSIAMDLLGDPSSWKEIWATNMNLQSKGIVDQDTEIVFWPEGSAPTSSPSLAMNQDYMPPEPVMPMEPAIAPPPPPAPPVMPEAPDAMGAVGSVTTAPPPPPAPPVVAAPPPPPPAPPAPSMDMPDADGTDMAERPTRKSPKAKQVKKGNDDMMLTIGIALLAVAGLLFVVQKKNKAKRMQMDITEQTQI